MYFNVHTLGRPFLLLWTSSAISLSAMSAKTLLNGLLVREYYTNWLNYNDLHRDWVDPIKYFYRCEIYLWTNFWALTMKSYAVLSNALCSGWECRQDLHSNRLLLDQVHVRSMHPVRDWPMLGRAGSVPSRSSRSSRHRLQAQTQLRSQDPRAGPRQCRAIQAPSVGTSW